MGETVFFRGDDDRDMGKLVYNFFWSGRMGILIRSCLFLYLTILETLVMFVIFRLALSDVMGNYEYTFNVLPFAR